MKLQCKKHLICWLAVLCLAGCGSKRRIEITTEYIINPHWNELANAVKINKMSLKKDSILDLAHLDQAAILSTLEEDSSFIWVANAKIASGEEYASKKIYFNKDNGFSWSTEDGKSTVITIGNLGKGCWYKFSHLVTYPYYVYIYVDSLNKVHRHDVDVSYY